MKTLKSFAQRVKEQAAKKVEEEVKAAANPELSKLQQELKTRELELNRYKKQLAEIEKVKAELEQYKNQTQKEKVTQAIKAELAATAKKLNVKESALEDVVGLLEGKFQYTQDGKVLPALPEGSEPVEPEQFISQWLENKPHFIQPPQAQPAGIKPVAQGVKPAAQPSQGNPLSANSINQLLGTGAMYKK